jgi:SulP family sulfate permease
MIVTFVATLLIPVQYAVLLGVALSIVAYVYSSSLDIRVVLLEPGPGGRYMEKDAPAQLPSAQVTPLDIYGSVFYAGTDVIERLIPKVGEASRPVAIIRLRGRTDVGSTFITFLDRYHGQVAAAGGRLMLAGVGADLMEQLARSGGADSLGLDNVFRAEEEIMASLDAAIAEGARWLDSTDDDPEKGDPA